MKNDGVDILILCAVPVEWDCLKGLITDAVSDPLLSDPAIRGRIEIGGRSVSSALVEVGMGLTTSALATLKAVEEYRPALVVFVGIAGGIKDVGIGDVVIADKVYPYEIGKVEGGQFQARFDTRTLPAQLGGIARKVRAEFTSGSNFRVFVGALASGEKVVADIDSAELRRIRTRGGDSLAIEMEGSAVLSAIDRAVVSPDYFLVRGISDLIADKSETDAGGGQERAIENARETTVRLIEAWNASAHVGVPIEQTESNLLAAGLPLPSPAECYVLVAPPNSVHAEAIVRSGLPISLIADLDSRSEDGGLLARTRSVLEARRAVHLGSPNTPPPFGTSSSAWVIVQGLDNPVSDLQKWTRTIRRSWRTALGTFAAAVGGRRVTILVVDDGDDTWDAWRSALVDDALTEFGERAYVGVLGTGRSIAPDFQLALHPDDLTTALNAMLPPEQASTHRVIPGAEGLVKIPATDASWIEEDATIYWAAEPDSSGAEAATLDFLSLDPPTRVQAGV